MLGAAHLIFDKNTAGLNPHGRFFTGRSTTGQDAGWISFALYLIHWARANRPPGVLRNPLSSTGRRRPRGRELSIRFFKWGYRSVFCIDPDPVCSYNTSHGFFLPIFCRLLPAGSRSDAQCSRLKHPILLSFSTLLFRSKYHHEPSIPFQTCPVFRRRSR